MINPTELARIRALHEEATRIPVEIWTNPRTKIQTLLINEYRVRGVKLVPGSIPEYCTVVSGPVLLRALGINAPALLAAAERLGEAEEALRWISDQGEKSDAKGTHSREVVKRCRSYFKRREEEKTDENDQD